MNAMLSIYYERDEYNVIKAARNDEWNATNSLGWVQCIGCMRQKYYRHKSEHKSWLYYSQCLSVIYSKFNKENTYKKNQKIIFVYPFHKTWKICNISSLSKPKPKIRFLSANIDISARFSVARKKKNIYRVIKKDTLCF